MNQHLYYLPTPIHAAPLGATQNNQNCNRRDNFEVGLLHEIGALDVDPPHSNTSDTTATGWASNSIGRVSDSRDYKNSVIG